MTFSDDQLLRYSRQILVKNFDISGQQALANAHVLIVGMGGLGCPAAQYLAAAGVGHLYLMDDDVIELSNLQRQILFSREQINTNKADAAKQRLNEINDSIQITALPQRFIASGLDTIVPTFDVVLDCTDNSATRLSLSQSCLQHKLPLVSGAAIGWQGQLTSFDFRASNSPCYQCLFNEFNDSTNCSENGIISPVVGLIGTAQALEALKIISNCGDANFNKFRCYDGLSSEWHSFDYQKNSVCRVCA